MAINIEQNLSSFIEEHNDENSRGKAYDCLHEVFLNEYKKGNPDYDYIALNLYAFLGSWGMLHFRSKLIRKNYKGLTKLTKLLVELAKSEDYSYLVDFEISKADSVKYREDILFLKAKITETLEEDYKDISVTDTLVGKILLGTFGCMPAFESNFCNAAKKEFSKNTITINNSIEKVYDWAKNNENELMSCKNKDVRLMKYPIMKLVDMVFWEAGK